MYRKTQLCTGEVYHIYTRSIAGFVLFNHPNEYARMRSTLEYSIPIEVPVCYSRYRILLASGKLEQSRQYAKAVNHEPCVQVIGHCLMPTHLHLLLKQIAPNGISNYMHRVLDSYSRYFNLLHKRKGPLWEGRFKESHINTDELLLHMSRYIHLNPVTAYLTDKPEAWPYSSYTSYLDPKISSPLGQSQGLIQVPPEPYRRFVENRIDYQRKLASIKHLLLEDPTTP